MGRFLLVHLDLDLSNSAEDDAENPRPMPLG
jgi:hypothetical protein